FFTFFFFLVSSSSQIYTLSLHDALPISSTRLNLAFLPSCHVATLQSATRPLIPKSNTVCILAFGKRNFSHVNCSLVGSKPNETRSEEHTSELQSRENLVCRLLLEKKKKK